MTPASTTPTTPTRSTKTPTKTAATKNKKINRTQEQKILWSLASTSYVMDMFLHASAGKDLEAFSFQLTHKEYYTGLSRLKRAKLIAKNRKEQAYRLTTLGKLIHHEIANIRKAVQYSDTFEAWDAMKSNFRSEDPDKLKAIAKTMFKDDVRKMISSAEQQS